MQFRGYHINNLKSYRKYFCFPDVVEALENGAYGEWLSALSEIIKEGGVAVSEDVRIIDEIRLLLGRRSQGGVTAGEPEFDEESWRTLFLLVYRLAHQPVTDVDMEKINRLVQTEAKKGKKNQSCGKERTDAGAEVLLTGKEYRLPVWRRKEREQVFEWKKLKNIGDSPVAVRIADETRHLNPGGYAWMLTQNGCFVRWGRRVQVHQRSFACVDRMDCLMVDGYPMQGEGMVDFSFDWRTGILGVDKDGGLRQYSSLELEGKTGNGEKFVFACLKGKAYSLVKEDGTIVTNLADSAVDLADVFSCQAAEKKAFYQKSAAKKLPFSAAVVSVSNQLIGFETPDSRVGVWDREQERMIWMEGAEWDRMQ